MITRIKRTYYVLISSIWFLLPSIAAAQYSSASTTAKPGGVAGFQSASGLIMKLTNFFLGFLGTLAVLMIIISGVMYVTSGGDKNQIDKAKSILLYSITGLVIALLAYAVVRIVSLGVGAS